ncbi:hypothetical protein CFS9_26720 [Flavobacterium sp. CFS9]|uniref:Peptidase M43 pregnancy-associated plasma-A domain-containing protein n=1 Tax=Flavobacterium sp. CFS9 TaxID=3143118 RepID=A0AAT9H3R3_9FLAO
MKFSRFILSAICLVISNLSSGQETNDIITIPVLFHVVFENDEQKNINTDLIKKELNDLHDDFMMLNRDVINVEPIFIKLIGNPRIKFILAADHPSGGIIFIKKTKKGRFYKSSPVISPERYLNVYIGNIYNLFKTVGVVYSSTPWARPESDAIFLNYSNIGKGERLLTHEAGHWLGLLHIFQDRNRCKAKYDDGIVDTPWQKKASGDKSGCYVLNSFENTCDPLLPAMYNNFMDYSNCRYMFTKGQCELMRSNLKQYRPNMFNVAAL